MAGTRDSLRTSSLRSTSRYVVGERLGAGAMGAVYRARDVDTGREVALKSLLHLTPDAILRFKREFRTLANISHVNLVSLYELTTSGDDWFYSMALVEGVDFLSWVASGRPRPVDEHRDPGARDAALAHSDTIASDLLAQPRDVAAAGSAPVTTPLAHDVTLAPDQAARASGNRSGGGLAHVETVLEAQSLAHSETIAPHLASSIPELVHAGPKIRLTPVPELAQPRPAVRRPVYADLARLRPAMCQLAEGIAALHDVGILHRDIKPSNVMVTPQGRVVVLDFGLAEQVEHNTINTTVSGTVAYMSPEQAAARRLAPASDWYAVGVMLYEALTGSLPFTGNMLSILSSKQHIDPAPPSELVDEVPADLDQLCRRLLLRDPDQRASRHDVLAVFGSRRAKPVTLQPSFRQLASASILIGREHHLGALVQAWERARRGQPTTVRIHGSSGMGKSTLIQHFLESIQTEGAVVLAGRCYERESVPYKAFDNLIDELSRHLKSIPTADLQRLIPADIDALARVFPTLNQVPEIVNAPRREHSTPNLQELRKQAFVALRSLIVNLAARQPLVLYIDDLQFGDADSAALLSDLLRPPNPPKIMLLLSYRSEHAQSNELLRRLREQQIGSEIEITPLSHDDAKALAHSLLGDRPSAAETADAIAREAHGSPLFVGELAHHAQRGGTIGHTSFEDMLRRRRDALPEHARQLLEVLVVAGRPVPERTAFTAAGIEPDPDTITVLRNGLWIQTAAIDAVTRLEPYHDRIRELLVTRLSPERLADCHRRLAMAMLESSESPDPEALAMHFHGAGDTEHGYAYATKAAERAAGALAFDRAASLYRLALEFRPDPDATRALNEKLGDALRNAGRGAEAAQAYRAAAEGATVARRLICQRLAAEQLLYSGHLDEGMLAIEDVLASVNLRLAKTPARALVSLLWRRLRLRMRGLRYQTRELGEISPDAIQLIDTCYGVGTSLAVVDVIRANDFQVLNLRLSLDAGDPYRIARSLALEAGFLSTVGVKLERRSLRVLQVAERLAQHIDNPHALAMVLLMSGISAYETGHLRASRDHCQAAEELLRTRCSGVAWELASARLFGTWSCYRIGDIASLIDRVPTLEREAAERGDLYGKLAMALGCPRIALTLATDDPGRHRQLAEEAIASWPGKGYQVQHYWADYALLHIDLYDGQPEPAWQRLTRVWPLLKRSLLLRVEEVSIYMSELRARIALALALRAPDPARYIQIAERTARQLSRKSIRWCGAMASLIRAQIAALLGHRERELELLADAQAGFELGELAPYAMVTRLRRGVLVGGHARDEHVRIVSRWAESQGVASVEGLTRMLAPVFGAPRAQLGATSSP